MSHFEVSPREKDDQERYDQHEFGTREGQEQDLRDTILRSADFGMEQDE